MIIRMVLRKKACSQDRVNENQRNFHSVTIEAQDIL